MPGRRAKTELLAALLRAGRRRRAARRGRLADGPDPPAPHRARAGPRCATLPPPAAEATLTVREVDAAFERRRRRRRARGRSGRPPRPARRRCSPAPPRPSSGSCAGWSPASCGRARWPAWSLEAVAGRPARAGRPRTAGGDARAATSARRGGRRSPSGPAALAAFRLRGRAARSRRCSRRPRPTWARPSSAPAPAAVEWKLDGVRVQVHRDGDDVARLHPHPRRHHRPGARGGRGGAGAAGARGRPGRRGDRPAARRAAAPVPGDRRRGRPRGDVGRPGARCR